MWMQSISSTDLALAERAQWISNARKQSRRAHDWAPPTMPSGVSIVKRSQSVPAPLLGIYCLIFACSLAFGLLGMRALGSASGHDEALGAENVR